MRVAVASGKGGTGKTTVSVNMTLSLDNVQLLDCDVEEPNCNIYLRRPLEHVEDVFLTVPSIDKRKCTFCRKCSEFCKYHALIVVPGDVFILTDLCHGCGGCFIACPENALKEKKKVIGVLERDKSNLDFIQGVLTPGERMATPIVAALKKKISNETVILDSPPGTGCSVIETVSGCDFCILIAEPTIFGLHDLSRAVNLTRTLRVPCGVIINKAGIGNNAVKEYCRTEGIPLLMEIPHSEKIARLCSEGIPFVREMPVWKKKFGELLINIEEAL